MVVVLDRDGWAITITTVSDNGLGLWVVLCSLPLDVVAQFAVLRLVAGKEILKLLALAVCLDVHTLFDATHGDGSAWCLRVI